MTSEGTCFGPVIYYSLASMRLPSEYLVRLHYKYYPQVLPILSRYLSRFSRCLAEIGNDWQSDG